jgi:thiol:disulfide interchange protein DsbD
MRIRRSRLALYTLAAMMLGVGLVVQADVTPLAPEKAFRFSARALNPQTVEARFVIADGYYLYRDKLHFALETAGPSLAVPLLPSGRIKEDQFFGRVETYRGNLIVNLTLRDTAPGQKVTVRAESQGCADLGICYPPNVQRVVVALPAAGSAPTPADQPPKKDWFQ